MLSIRISQHFNYKPLFSGFVYLNWMNLVLLKVSAYNAQARVQQAQPCPSVRMSMWDTGPEWGCPNHAGSFWQWEHWPPLQRSQVPAPRCLQLWLLSQSLPYVCSRAQSSSPRFSPQIHSLPWQRTCLGADAQQHLSVTSSPLLNLLSDSPVSKATFIFFCSPDYWGTRIRRKGWETSVVLQELGP